MVKWEYLTVELTLYKGQVLAAGPPPWMNKELGEIGDQGWESVTTIRVEGKKYLLFKRQVS